MSLSIRIAPVGAFVQSSGIGAHSQSQLHSTVNYTLVQHLAEPDTPGGARHLAESVIISSILVHKCCNNYCLVITAHEYGTCLPPHSISLLSPQPTSNFWVCKLMPTSSGWNIPSLIWKFIVPVQSHWDFYRGQGWQRIELGSCHMQVV